MKFTIEDKIKKLRVIYTTPEDQQELDEMEKKLRRRIVEEEFAEHPIVQAIIADAKKKVAEINFLLTSDRTLTDAERSSLFNKREIAQFYLDRFGVKDTSIEDLERDVDKYLMDAQNPSSKL